MRALTLNQPYASLIAVGVKSIETRGWNTNYRGPLAIHAAKLADGDAARDLWQALSDEATDIVHTDDDGCWPSGAVVATCVLHNVLPIRDADETTTSHWCIEARRGGLHKTVDRILDREGLATTDISLELPFGDFTPGRYAWILDDVVPLPAPVPVRGRQGLWNWTDGRVSS